MHRALPAEGADEIWLLDISASTEGRKTNLDMVKAAAAHCTVPAVRGRRHQNLDDADAGWPQAHQGGRRLPPRCTTIRLCAA